MAIPPLPRSRTRHASGAALGLLLAVLGLVAPPAASAVLDPVAYDPGAIEKSVVQLYIEWSGAVGYDGDHGEVVWLQEPVAYGSSCSGVFVTASAHIATAGHCVDNSDPATIGNELAAAYLRSQGNTEEQVEQKIGYMWYDETTITRTVYAYQNESLQGAVLPARGLVTEVVAFQNLDQGDNALLRVTGFTEPTPALPVRAGAAAVGDRVTAIGFPALVGTVSEAGRQRASFKSGEVSSVQTWSSGVAFVEISAAVSAGMSGGPVVDGNGEVVGCVSFGPGNGQAFNFATTDLDGFLLTHGVDPASAETLQPVPVQPRTATAG
ncbi:hypothetical protein GCM10023081_02810 [Arthrobacter ginkgonis]|uniref:Serine protease n=1 Tax=Arthrobacter ginkgonis TaxID=1630594 RepID=A0ABP7BQW9_9MICC